MMKAKPINKPETAVKTMLLEDRADAMAYIKEQLTLNALRIATQNLQAVCNIVYQILDQDKPNILDAYKVANFVATAYHDDIDIFKEIERASIESHKGNLFVPTYVNLNDAYISDKFTGAKSGYLVEGIANMFSILNLTAHILSRECLTKKSLFIAKWILDQASYKFGKNIVAATNMINIWNKVVSTAKETITGAANKFITIGETRSIYGHKIFFTPNGIFVDDNDPVITENEIIRNRTYVAMFFMNLDAWLYFYKSGEFGILRPQKRTFDMDDKLKAPRYFTESLYRELVA